jgi:hypothetical protein
MAIVTRPIAVMTSVTAIVDADSNVDRRTPPASRRLVQAFANDLAAIVDVPAMPSLIGIILAGKTGRRSGIVAALSTIIDRAKLFFVSRGSR